MAARWRPWTGQPRVTYLWEGMIPSVEQLVRDGFNEE